MPVAPPPPPPPSHLYKKRCIWSPEPPRCPKTDLLRVFWALRGQPHRRGPRAQKRPTPGGVGGRGRGLDTHPPTHPPGLPATRQKEERGKGFFRGLRGRPKQPLTLAYPHGRRGGGLTPTNSEFLGDPPIPYHRVGQALRQNSVVAIGGGGVLTQPPLRG